MTIYWIMLIFPTLALLTPIKLNRNLSTLNWLWVSLCLILIVGLRHEVGGDWENYITHNSLYVNLKNIDFIEVFSINNLSADIGFLIIHWFSQNYLYGIYSTNLICAAIFVVGLQRLCRNEPFPWIALIVSMPYLIIVVSMGYTRQAAALGFIMWGLVSLMSGQKGKFYLSIAFAVLLHKTALVMFIVGLLSNNYHLKYNNHNKRDYLIFGLMFIFIAINYSKFANMVHFYITNTTMESSGAFIRVMVSSIAALVFLSFRKHWKGKYGDYHIWLIFSILTLIMLPLTFIISTTIDRIALYFLPMQVVIFSRISALIKDDNLTIIYILSLLILYFSILFVWLNYGSYSIYWIPYSNILF